MNRKCTCSVVLLLCCHSVFYIVEPRSYMYIKKTQFSIRKNLPTSRKNCNANSLKHSAVSLDNDIESISSGKLYEVGSYYRGSTVFDGIA